MKKLLKIMVLIIICFIINIHAVNAIEEIKINEEAKNTLNSFIMGINYGDEEVINYIDPRNEELYNTYTPYNNNLLFTYNVNKF